MRADLLEAKAAIDWAKSQTNVVVRRIVEWIESTPYVVAREINRQAGQDIFKVQVRREFYLVINAEVGAIINSFRSSLDLLASALYTRHSITKVGMNEVYFPIASSAAKLPTAKGYKFVKALPIREQTIIENLKPYAGGNDLLFTLHEMDIARKHRALVRVSHPLRSVGVFRWSGIGEDVKILYASGEPLKNGTILATAPTGHYHQLAIRPDVTFSNAHALTHKPVGAGLRDFARLTQAILKDFDIP